MRRYTNTYFTQIIMKRQKNKWLLLPVLFGMVACENHGAPTVLSEAAIIPRPTAVADAAGVFALTAKTVVYVQESSEEAAKTGQYLADLLAPATGFRLSLQAASDAPPAGLWFGLTDNDEELGAEGYRLTVTPRRVSLIANTGEGLFHAVQTLRQLLPPEIEAAFPQQVPWLIAAGTIMDYPEYGYRSAMLDVARHFFTVDDVKHYIDLLAAYKMNMLHLHLSDDQGWRIEIKSWPELTNIGGQKQVGGGSGGFYTQEQYQDIVSYALDRYITVVPEIDMPGHTNAALASYPELNSDGNARELYTGIEVGFSSLCTDKEVTFKFVDDVIRELAAITPGPYIHIGGDESHSTKKDDYIGFINRVQDIVLAYDKIMIGWDEIVSAELNELSVAQYWSSAANARTAVNKGTLLVISPASRAYMDMKYDSTTALGLKWAGYISVKHGYDWDPTTIMSEVTRDNVLGIEAPLWSETIETRSNIEFMALPRLPGYAEIGWTGPARSWDEYRRRLAVHGKRFAVGGSNFFRAPDVPWE